MQKMSRQLVFVAPMECAEVRHIEDIPAGDDWQYEVKFDGYRCITLKQRGDVEMYSRRGNAFKQFMNLFEPLRTQRAKSFIIDGEIVALHESGHFNFNALQNWGRSRVKVHFYIFDLLHLNGSDLMSKPLFERQKILQDELVASDFIHLPTALDAPLTVILDKIKEFGLEGIVAKRRDSIYVPGKKTGTWVKKKLKQTDEFIVGGFIPSGKGVEQLIVGKYRGKELVYVASLDDGFVPATRRAVFQKVAPLEIANCPFVNLPERKGPHRMDTEKMKEAKWVKPRFVAEIAMNEWTPDKHLRHGEFLRLRPDKSVKDVSPYPEDV